MVTILAENLEGLIAPILSGPKWDTLPNVFKVTETTDTKIFQCPSECTAEVSIKIVSKIECSVKFIHSSVETYSNTFFDSIYEVKNITVGPGQSLFLFTDDIGNGVDIKVNIDGKVFGPYDYGKIL